MMQDLGASFPEATRPGLASPQTCEPSGQVSQELPAYYPDRTPYSPPFSSRPRVPAWWSFVREKGGASVCRAPSVGWLSRQVPYSSTSVSLATTP